MTLEEHMPAACATAVIPSQTDHPQPFLAGGNPKTPVILALDLGHCTGWALRSACGVITSGVAEFRPDRWQGGGMKFLRFRRWLTELKADAGGLDAVFYEQVRNHAGVDASHAYGGWLAILTAWCEHHGIPYQGVPVGTIKRHVTGKGNADKAEVIDAVRRLGFAPADDNEADALALLHWAIAQGIGGAR
jgi:crossover junction endodeoxyribonuclease RuvC